MISLATFLLSIASLPLMQEPAVVAEAAESSVVGISQQERLDRTYIYASGARYIVQLELNAAIEAEIKRRKAAGAYVGDVNVSQEDVDFEVQRRMEMVLAQDPTVDFWQLMHAQGFTKETFAQDVRRSIIGQRMFFPLDPGDWPVEQIKEIMLPRWQENLRADYETLLEMKAKGEFRLLEEGQLNQFLMPGVWLYLYSKMEVTKPSQGLPEGVCLKIGDRSFATKDVLATIEPLITDVDRDWAQSFLKHVQLLEKDLKASGHYLDQAAFETYFAEEKARYNDFFPHEQMVLTYYGFPSMESYRQYLRVRRSFRATLPADGTPEYQAMLQQLIKAQGPGYGGGRVQVDVLLLSARDKATGKFVKSGDPYLEAVERAAEVGQILASGEPFDQILLEYSDYPPSLSISSNTASQPNRGRFERVQRHELRSFLNESDFSDFIFGYAVTDDIFFRSAENDIFGPIKGPLGYSFYRVLGHSAPRMELDIEGDPSVKWQVNEDLLTYHFLKHLRELNK
jgi:hypothetical protein